MWKELDEPLLAAQEGCRVGVIDGEVAARQESEAVSRRLGGHGVVDLPGSPAVMIEQGHLQPVEPVVERRLGQLQSVEKIGALRGRQRQAASGQGRAGGDSSGSQTGYVWVRRAAAITNGAPVGTIGTWNARGYYCVGDRVPEEDCKERRRGGWDQRWDARPPTHAVIVRVH